MQLVLAALGACTAMTIQMVARNKKWPLGEVSVDLSYERIHAKDCEDWARETLANADKAAEREGFTRLALTFREQAKRERKLAEEIES